MQNLEITKEIHDSLFTFLISMYRKSLGYYAEKVAKNHYSNCWWKLIAQNRTVRWWEIDLIMQRNKEICFIEVKAVYAVDDLHNYISSAKLRILHRTIQTRYHRTTWFEWLLPRVDVVFVRDNAILHTFEYCTIY